jgi:hypothetical protein
VGALSGSRNRTAQEHDQREHSHFDFHIFSSSEKQMIEQSRADSIGAMRFRQRLFSWRH